MLSDAGKEGYNEDGDSDGDASNGRHRNSLRNQSTRNTGAVACSQVPVD